MDLTAERSYPTPFANSTLLSMLLLSLMKQKHTPDTATTISTEYDYVIVGAGSAGSVLASRLSEVPCVTVLLLEAGKPPPYLTEVPSLSRSFWFTDIDWAYRTVPQKYTGNGLINRQVVWPSGKAIGGSSILNGNIYVRGNRRNYDNWTAQGAKGWSYKDVLPYFLKMEDNKDPEYIANGYHGVGGPVTVHRPQYQSEIRAPIFQAAIQMGYRIVDPNGGRQTGFYDLQGTLRDGQRCSSAKAYLVPAENRTNLDILPNAMVRKVLIRKRRARGVQFDFRGTTYEVKAKREVILSAGTTNTAQLLMLSGIGPKKELDRFKIPVKADLPVGKNLQDHIGVDVNFLLNSAIPEIRAKLLNPVNIHKYIQNRTGPLASLEFCSANAFLKKHAINPREDFPNHEVNFLEGTTLNAFLQFGLRPEVYEQVYGPYRGKPFITCVPHLLQPRSRGTVTLQSDNPYDPPMIDPNYLEDPRDVKDIVEGMKVCRRISLSAPLKRLGSVPFATLYPGCEQYAGNEDDYFRCQLRSVVLTFSHYVGTAKMGDPEDPTTVVDPQLRFMDNIHESLSMSRRSHLPDSLRWRAIGWREIGMSQADAARRRNVSRSVVHRQWNQSEYDDSVSRRQVPGRPRVTTSAGNRYLALSALRKSSITVPQLIADHLEASETRISATTVLICLHNAGLYARRPVICVHLTRVHRGARLCWAREHISWSSQQWASVPVTDESRLILESDSGRQVIWREQRTRYNQSHILEGHSYRDGEIMISLGGHTYLCVFHTGTLTGVRYRDEILDQYVRPYAAVIGPGFLLMDDNARPHRTH